MNSIRVNILGRTYPLKVLDGEEELMTSIAEFVDARFKLFKNELATHPEQTIMVLASLSIAEELFALQKKVKELQDVGLSTDEAAEISDRIDQLLGAIND